MRDKLAGIALGLIWGGLVLIILSWAFANNEQHEVFDLDIGTALICIVDEHGRMVCSES